MNNFKTGYYESHQECNLNLLQTHATGSINLEQILQMFIKETPGRLCSQSLVFSET